MLKANLYIDRIDLARYLTPEEVSQSGARDANELAARLQDGTLAPAACPFFGPTKRYALSLALNAAEVLPIVQSLELPRPTPPDLLEINEPDPSAPVIVTGNSEFTLTVMTGILATTISPLYLLSVDCRGDTVDMSMIYRSFTPQRLDQSLLAHKLAGRLAHRRLVIPGIIAPLKEELASYTGWEIAVGPICAAELPLFMGEAWQPPPG
jgi:CO dehydrogenase/acetyl-CoA synthase gamma subunit (corrinoid Fe-S protein)